MATKPDLSVLPERYEKFAGIATGYAVNKTARRNRILNAFTGEDLYAYAVERLLTFVSAEEVTKPTECLRCKKAVNQDPNLARRWQWYCSVACRSWCKRRGIYKPKYDSDTGAYWRWHRKLNGDQAALSQYVTAALKVQVLNYAVQRIKDSGEVRSANIIEQVAVTNQASESVGEDHMDELSEYPILRAVHLGGRKAESVAMQMGLTQDEYNAQYEREMQEFKDWALRSRRVSTSNGAAE